MNPFGDLSSCHFTWPVVLLNYNLPPWLVTKRYFMMLAIIIPSKESMTSGNIDVYLEPLIEELQMLWNGLKLMIHYRGQHSTWRLCVCGVYMTFQPMDWLQNVLPKSCGMPILCPNYKSSLFKEIKENDLLWESTLTTKDPSLSTSLDCF